MGYIFTYQLITQPTQYSYNVQMKTKSRLYKRFVHNGSDIDFRGIIPGAFISTRRDSSLFKAPLPSIGNPKTLSVRPNNPIPTGTLTIVLVRFTDSPSFIKRSFPNTTTPTLSLSRLKLLCIILHFINRIYIKIVDGQAVIIVAIL